MVSVSHLCEPVLSQALSSSMNHNRNRDQDRMASARNQPCNDNKSKLSVKFHGMEAGVASAARSHGILVGSSSPCWKSSRRPLLRQRNLQMASHYGARAFVALVGLRFYSKLSSLPHRLAHRSRMSAQPNLESVLTFWFGDEVLHARERLSDTGYLRGRTKMWYLSGSRYDEVARVFLPLVKQEHALWQRRTLG